MTEVQTAFTLIVDRNGMVTVNTDPIPGIEVDRVATLFDVETYCAYMSRSAGRTLAVYSLAALMKPESEPAVADRVADALRKRDTGTEVTEE